MTEGGDRGFEFPKSPDVDELLDEPVKRMFENAGGYFLHDKLLAQLIYELQLQRGRRK